MDDETISSEKKLGLVNAEGLLTALWPLKESRPSVRFIRDLQAKRLIPYRKISSLVFFDPVEVRQALDKNFKVKSIEG